MTKAKRFLIGGVVILAAISYLVMNNLPDSMVYFQTPSELKAQERGSGNKSIKMGGMVVKGSLQKDLPQLTYKFEITDGSATFPVYFKGVPPDLFVEGKGAVVEGRVESDGVFHATTIMAKHAEDYSPHTDGKTASKSFIPAKEAGAK